MWDIIMKEALKDAKNNFCNFKNLDITTSVLTCELKSNVDFMMLFLAYPCSPQSKRLGSVNYLRCLDQSRGIYHKVEKPKFFKNSTMMVARINREKIINIKIFENKMQISGSKNLEDTEKCLSIIMENIYNIKKVIRHLKKDKERSKLYLDWFLEKIKGKLCLINKNMRFPNSDYYIKRKKIDHLAKDVKYKNLKIPENIDKASIKFFFNCVKDVISMNHKVPLSSIKERLLYLIDTNIDLYDGKGPLRYKKLSYHMANLNTDLGFTPDRSAFRDVFNSYGICASYINALSSHTKIQISVSEESEKQKNKKKRPRSTIMVHRTGKVTHSSRHVESLERAYNIFTKIVEDNKRRLVLKKH